MSTEPSAIATDLRAMAAAAERQADDFDKTDAQKMLAAAEALDRLAALEAVAEAAQRWAAEESRRRDALNRMDWAEMENAKGQLDVYAGPALQAAVAALDALEDQP